MINKKKLLLRCGLLAFCALGMFAGLPMEAKAQEKVVKLTSLEWPPFSGEKLQQNGAFTAVVRAAYEAMGYKIEVKFLPWNRAMQLVKDKSEYVGYFPEYDAVSIRTDYHLSSPMGSSPIGLAQRNDKKVTWSTLGDLKAYTIATQDGYTNTEEFDKMAAEKKLNIDVNVDETTCLRKLAAGRVDLSVIDKNVMAYLLKNESSLKGVAEKLTFNEKILAEKELFIAFRKDEEGKKMDAILKEGLAKIDVKAVMDKYLAQ